MKFNYTDDQNKVIHTRGSSVLVSASAGSGKTAVLVARILSFLTDEKDPADIDQLLIVTFTKAAAAEMKERIGRAIEDALKENTENEHLLRQSSLIHNAQITTIDGFCSYILRSYGYLTDLEPGFRIAEEGEMALMKADVLQEVLEERFASENPEEQKVFSAFVETFATGKSEKAMEDAILKTFSAAESQPWPFAWLEKCRNENRAASFEELEKTEWMQGFQKDADDLVRTGLNYAKANKELTLRADGPSAYQPTADQDLEFFISFMKSADYDSRVRMAQNFSQVRLSTKKPLKEEDAALREVFKSNRAEVDAIRKELTESFYAMPKETVLRFMSESAQPLDTLISVTEAFMERFAKKKREKSLVDFSDLEHYALEILRGKDGAAPETSESNVFGSPEADATIINTYGSPEADTTIINTYGSPEARQPQRNLSPTPVHGRTQAAAELSHRFREVMVDEYQDSNYLQEAILTAVSRIEEGENNYFCVGDVKQSIYAFRHARPELFMEKFHTYRTDSAQSSAGAPAFSDSSDGAALAGASVSSDSSDGAAFAGASVPSDFSNTQASDVTSASSEPRGSAAGVRIDLQQNFRSRHEVLDTVNGFFSQLMQESVGGVSYDRDAELICGASYPEAENGACDTEIMTVFSGEEDEEGKEFLSDQKQRAQKELEARAIADRIKYMVNHEKIWDEKEEEYRPVTYHDIVILLRTMEGWADVFGEVLESQGIPAFSSAKSGYFSALEVVTVLNYLSIIDNPRQDIPFTAVLKSAIAGLSAEDLAKVRTVKGSPSENAESACLSMSECARLYLESGADAELRQRLASFFEFYDRMRAGVSYTPIHELIWTIVTGTGFLDYAAALPGGIQRVANIRMLVERAIAYENTSYVGLFNFVRYIGNLKKYDVDFGEVNVVGENENVVRIVSIHKSKGLEYPIVFAAGMNKSFNKRDLSAGLLIHPDYGLAIQYVDYTARTKTPTLKYQAVARKLRKDSAGEELRVFYVALTRARQKLILSGILKNEDKLQDMALTLPLAELQFPANYILRVKNGWEFFLPAAERMVRRAEAEGKKPPFIYNKVRPSELALKEIGTQTQEAETLAGLSALDGRQVFDKKMRAAISERFSYAYPYALLDLPVKVSVSELKHAHMEDEEVGKIYEEPEIVPYIPDFMKEEKAEAPEASSGAARGTAYHKVMQLLDFTAASGAAEEIRGFIEDGRLSKEEADMVNAEDVALFAASALGQRMAEAERGGRLYREQPFVFGVGAKEINPEWPEDETVLVQGIIDAFFYEGDGIVLLDYKTDFVRSPEVLVSRYQVQLDSYADALGRVTGKTVKERFIYSFCLKKAIKTG